MMVVLLGLYLEGAGQADSGRLKQTGIPVAGDTMFISYHPAGGPLEGRDGISGMVYMYNDYHWIVDDIALKNNKGIWEGAYLLPVNCAFVAVKFVTDENGTVVAADNNNDLGFVATTIDKKGRRLPGGTLAWGIFRKPSIGKAPNGYFDKFDISNEALEMWVRKEMEAYPQYISKYFDSYLAMLKLKTGEEFAEKAPRNMEKFSKEPGIGEDGYITIWDTYRLPLKDEHRADSVRNIILQKFPVGKMARLARYNEAYAMPLDEKKLIALEQFLHDFPVAAYRHADVSGSQRFIYYNTYRVLASAYFASAQNDKLLALLPDMDFATLNEIFRWNIDRIFTLGKLPLERIYPISHALMDEMIKKKNDLSYMEQVRYTPHQADEIAAKQMDNKLSIHIRLLNKMEKYTEALPYLNYLSEKGRFADAALNEAHVSILEHIGGEKMILPVLEMSVRNNAATPLMLTQLKKIYEQRSHTTDGFDAYVESLKSAEDIKKIKEDLRSKLLHEKVMGFSLKDMSGKTINTATWKNKIVILDYWATWCFPCKMAFPGMQLAVDRYAKDTTVDFYFIATMERTKTYKEDIKKYIQSSGYRFNVLYDDKNSKTGDNDRVFKSMVPVFHSSAIPRKVIIKDGYIRYTAEGYGGSPSKLMDELSYVIEMLKSE